MSDLFPPGSPEHEVWQVLREFNDAFARNDADGFFKHIDEHITTLTPSSPYRVEGIKADREEFEYSLRLGRTRVGYFQELQPYVQVFGDAALATYYSRGTYGPDAKSAYLKETDVLVKRDGVWKVVHIHISTTG